MTMNNTYNEDVNLNLCLTAEMPHHILLQETGKIQTVNYNSQFGSKVQLPEMLTSFLLMEVSVMWLIPFTKPHQEGLLANQ